MGAISASTGHSPQRERKVAKILYISLVIAVAFALFMSYWAGKRTRFDSGQGGAPPHNISADDIS